MRCPGSPPAPRPAPAAAAGGLRARCSPHPRGPSSVRSPAARRRSGAAPPIPVPPPPHPSPVTDLTGSGPLWSRYRAGSGSVWSPSGKGRLRGGKTSEERGWSGGKPQCLGGVRGVGRGGLVPSPPTPSTPPVRRGTGFFPSCIRGVGSFTGARRKILGDGRGGLELTSCPDQLVIFFWGGVGGVGCYSSLCEGKEGGRDGGEGVKDAEIRLEELNNRSAACFGCALLIKCSLETHVRIKRHNTINIHGA